MENLDKLYNELYHESIELPEEQEQRIVEVSTSVANHLYLSANNKAYAEFFEHKYIFGFRRNYSSLDNKVYMVVCDEGCKTPTGKPRIFNVVMEIENNLSLVENLKAAVEAFLRDQLGLASPEILED